MDLADYVLRGTLTNNTKWTGLVSEVLGLDVFLQDQKCFLSPWFNVEEICVTE